MSWWGDSGLDKLAIIGLGQIGASLGLAARRASLAARIAGYDIDPAAAAEALAAGAVTEAAISIDDAVARADLVVLAMPVGEIVRLVPEIAETMPPRAVLTDVGSAKGPVVDAMERAPGHAGRCVGGHPLAGGEQRGAAAARADLFEGCRWVLCPGPSTRGDVLHSLRCVVSALGARPVMMDAGAHDREVALTSHLPYITAAALCLALADSADGRTPSLCGGSIRDCTRVAASDPVMAGDYCLANRDFLSDGVGVMIDRLEDLRKALREQDEHGLRRALSRAREYRASVSVTFPPVRASAAGEELI